MKDPAQTSVAYDVLGELRGLALAFPRELMAQNDSSKTNSQTAREHFFNTVIVPMLAGDSDK